MAVSDDRYLRGYCPTHRKDFTTAGAVRIVCEVGDESLALDFPQQGFWGYGCDCQSFGPSNISLGGSAAGLGPVCGKEAALRHMCDLCKVLSRESYEAGCKSFTITTHGAVEPSCPGGLKDAGLLLRQHSCHKVGATFTTAHTFCPFCHEPVRKASQEKTLVIEPDYGWVAPGVPTPPQIFSVPPSNEVIQPPIGPPSAASRSATPARPRITIQLFYSLLIAPCSTLLEVVRDSHASKILWRSKDDYL